MFFKKFLMTNVKRRETPIGNEKLNRGASSRLRPTRVLPGISAMVSRDPSHILLRHYVGEMAEIVRIPDISR